MNWEGKAYFKTTERESRSLIKWSKWQNRCFSAFLSTILLLPHTLILHPLQHIGEKKKNHNIFVYQDQFCSFQPPDISAFPAIFNTAPKINIYTLLLSFYVGHVTLKNVFTCQNQKSLLGLILFGGCGFLQVANMRGLFGHYRVLSTTALIKQRSNSSNFLISNCCLFLLSYLSG